MTARNGGLVRREKPTETTYAPGRPLGRVGTPRIKGRSCSLGIERYNQLRFRQADGTVLERWIGPAFVHVEGKRTTDDVAFGEPGDLVVLGARSLEGLTLRVDAVSKRLVDAGPLPAVAALSGSGAG